MTEQEKNRLACRINAILPGNRSDAMAVLRLSKEIITEWFDEKEGAKHA